MAELAYAPSRLSEATPSQIRYDMAKRVSSLIVDTNQVIVYPKSGSTSVQQGLQGTNEIEFNIASTPYMLDPASVMLLMDITVNFNGDPNINDLPNATANYTNDVVAVQESICPWFYLARVFINGAQHESISDCDLATHLHTWHMSRDTYKTKATFANPGLAKWRELFAVNTPEDVDASANIYPAIVNVGQDLTTNDYGWGALSAGTGNKNSNVSRTRQVAIPLQWLALFSGRSFLPPQVGGNITLKFTTNQVSRMFGQLQGNGVSPNQNQIKGINFANIRLAYRSVQVADEVLMMVADMAARGPLHLPCIHHRVQNDSLGINGPAAGPSQFNLVLATSNLVSLFHYFLDQDQLSGATPLIYNKNPGFGLTGSYYAEIGGKQFPSVNQAIGNNILYMNYEEAVAGPFCLSQEYYAPVQAAVGFARTGAFRLGLSFERLLGAVADGVSAGYSTKNAAGLVRVFLKPSDSAVSPTGSAVSPSCASTDRLISVARYMEYVLVSAAGVSSTNIGS
jgi:hypothetical protein